MGGELLGPPPDYQVVLLVAAIVVGVLFIVDCLWPFAAFLPEW